MQNRQTLICATRSRTSMANLLRQLQLFVELGDLRNKHAEGSGHARENTTLIGVMTLPNCLRDLA